MRACLALGPLLLLSLSLTRAVVSGKNTRPHILYIMADDWGWGDVSWGDKGIIHTPYLESLRQNSLELTQFYTQPKCTPTRGAFMTGRYPYKMGLQTSQVFTRVLNNTLDYSLKLLPSYLKDLGYHTHLSGKWHLGDCNPNTTPIKRGFDSHFGCFTNLDDHFNNTSDGSLNWHWNNEPYWPAHGTYNTDLITNHTQFLLKNHFKNNATKDDPIFIFVSYMAPHKPVQAPKRYIAKTNCSKIPRRVRLSANETIKTSKRRTYCAMVASMDDSIKQIMRTLRKLRVDRKFITVISSDNGGGFKNQASNWPLRGAKQSIYEGGTRVRTLLHAPKFLKKGQKTGTYDGLVHITDMLPTLLEAAKGNLSVLPKDIDGISAWKAIRSGKATKRQWMVYNIDSSIQKAALRFKNGTHDFKLIFSNASETEPGYRILIERSEEERKNDPRQKRYDRNGTAYFLYNMATNPDERPPVGDRFPDAAKDNVEIFNVMKEKLTELMKDEVLRPYYVPMELDKNVRRRGGAWRVTGC